MKFGSIAVDYVRVSDGSTSGLSARGVGVQVDGAKGLVSDNVNMSQTIKWNDPTSLSLSLRNQHSLSRKLPVLLGDFACFASIFLQARSPLLLRVPIRFLGDASPKLREPLCPLDSC